MKHSQRSRARVVAGLLLSVAFCLQASADELQPLSEGWLGTKPLADIRLRYEDVQQAPLANSAVALTVRARLGIETGRAWGTSFLAEGNFLAPLIDHYRSDNAVASNTRYPVVADPRESVLNRLQLTNISLPDTTVTLGRQRINLDDQRFIGSVNWRQDEQTFDALRVVNKSVSNVVFDFSYLNRVHRVYGADSPQGTYTGDFYLGNISYKTPIGKLTGFAYLLSFDPLHSFPGLTPSAAGNFNPVRQSTQTVGGRFSDHRTVQSFGWGYLFAYASQKPRGDNPVVFKNDYWLAEVSGSFRSLSLTIGDERMDGNGTIGFSTPLATTHAFDGWADKFLTTPANGLDNRYGTLLYDIKAFGPFKSASFLVTYRSFEAQRSNTSYGSEWDFRVAAKWQRLTTSVFYADYSASPQTPLTIARDTRKLWLQCDFVW